MRSYPAWLALFLCLLSQMNVPVATADEPVGVWLDVPFVKQEKDGCGSASIAMVMQYWERQLGMAPTADPKEIQQALYSRRAGGIYASDVESYFTKHGYRTFVFQGTWEDLRQQLTKGRPLVVALKVARDDLHYVVVTGLDLQQNVLLKNDPAERKLLRQRRSSFEKEWKAAASWTLLAVPQPNGRASSR